MRKIGLRAKFINSSVNIFKLKTLSLPCLHEWKQSSLREVCVCLSSYWEVVIKWRNQRGTHPFPKFKWKHWCIKIRAQTLHHHLKIGIHGRNPAALVTFVGLDFVGPPYHHYYYVQSPPCSNASIHISSGGAERLDWIMRGFERKIIQTHHRHVQHGLRSNSYQTLKAYVLLKLASR